MINEKQDWYFDAYNCTFVLLLVKIEKLNVMYFSLLLLYNFLLEIQSHF